MQNHHIERHEKPAVANSIAKYTRLCKGREERFFIMRNSELKKKTPSEEKPRKGNAIAHNQHIRGEGQRTLTAGPLRNAAGQ